MIFTICSSAKLRRPLSLSLLKTINELATKQHDLQLMLLLQRFEPAAKIEYEIFLNSAKIAFIDGSHPQEHSPEMQLVGDTHPNAVMNKYWGEIVAQAITDRFENSSLVPTVLN